MFITKYRHFTNRKILTPCEYKGMDYKIFIFIQTG